MALVGYLIGSRALDFQSGQQDFEQSSSGRDWDFILPFQKICDWLKRYEAEPKLINYSVPDVNRSLCFPPVVCCPCKIGVVFLNRNISIEFEVEDCLGQNSTKILSK